MADELPDFAYTAEWRTCLWCGSPLADADAFFDTDICGRAWAEQYAQLGYRLHKEDIFPLAPPPSPTP